MIENDSTIMLELLACMPSQLNEADYLVREIVKKRMNKKVLLETPKGILEQLPFTNTTMSKKGERIIFTKDLLEKKIISNQVYEVWSISEPRAIHFLSEVMEQGIQETEKFLQSMRSELPDQVDNILTVHYDNHIPIGVVIPHIEPDTDSEGRIFWIGLHPQYRGKGYGRNLHNIGLERLQQDFQAKTYLGATQIENEPMKNIMIANGCKHFGESVISLEYKRKNDGYRSV